MKETRKEHVQARVTPTVLEAAQRAAEDAGITLSTLVYEVLRDRVQEGESKDKDEVID